jgi:deoxyribose-phosphate aldolase
MDAARARLAISLLDLTNLQDRCTAADVDVLCRRAIDAGTAAVCVWPDFVRQSVHALLETEIAVATVVNFPTGDERPFSVRALTERALADGADEIDVVLPFRAFMDGDLEWCAAVLGGVRAATEGAAKMKVILETGELDSVDRMTEAARFAIDQGADFVKTSTGKTPESATPQSVGALLAVIAEAGRTVGLKPSGGISTAEVAGAYLDQVEAVMGRDYLTPATFRFGASGVLDSLATVAAG